MVSWEHTDTVYHGEVLSENGRVACRADISLNRDDRSGRQRDVYRKEALRAICNKKLSAFSAVPAGSSVHVTSPFRTLEAWIIVFSSIFKYSPIHTIPHESLPAGDGGLS
jgi:hypothetical protein